MNSKIISMALVIVMMTSILAPVSASFSYGNDNVGTSSKDVGAAGAQDDQSGGFQYTSNDTAVTITGYDGPGGNVIVPDTIEGKPVEVIGDGAFYYNAALTSIIVPDTVINIGEYAFYYCSALISVTLPHSIESIGAYAFQGCTGLTSITIPNGIKSISASAFRGCSALTSVIIPDGVESIGNYAFYGCSALTSVVIGSGVTTIGSSAFRGCSALTSISIPDIVESIGASAFQSCAALILINLGDGVKTIGSSAFSSCSALTAINVAAGNTAYASVDGVLYNKTMDKLLLCPAKKAGSLDIPDTVTSIEASAFSGCTALTSVNIPNSIKTIGTSAFAGCSALTSITIPNGVESIDNSAFRDCTALMLVTIGSGVKILGNSVFSGCIALRSVTLPQGIESIGTSAFSGCTALTSVVIPNSVTSLGNSAFYGCTALTSAIIGSGVPTIGSSTFSDCTALVTINVDEGNANYASFDGVLYSKDKTTLILCPLGKSSLVMPSTLRTIGDNAFSGNTRLVQVQIPDNVVSIGSSAFYGCTALTTVTIGNGVTTIGGYVFSGCTALTSVVIPNSVTSLGNSAFYGCTALTTVTIGSGVASITRDSFSGCTALVSINVAAGNTAYASVDGVLYNKTMDKLLLCPAKKAGSLDIPDTVTSIEASAFQSCAALTSITMPDSVKSIGTYAFSGCTALTTVTIGNGVTSIGEYAFQRCTALTTVTIGNAVSNIGNWAFYTCTALESVTIPNSVTSIGNSAFYGCTALTTVTIGSGVKTIGSQAFAGCTALTDINVDKNNADHTSVNGVLYDKDVTKLILCPLGKSGSLALPGTLRTIDTSAFQGCTRLVHVQIPNGVTSIGISAFSGCSGLTSMVLPNSVTEIGLSAFSGCSGLTAVSIGDGVKTIGTYAFSGCTALTEITIPLNVESIGNSAFYGCTGLTSVIIGNGVKNIDAYAFQNCGSMTSLTLGSSLKTIGYQAFIGCNALIEITVDENNADYTSVDGVLYNKTMDKLIWCPPGKTGSFIVPDTVTGIHDYAFESCTALTSVTIGRNVESIGNSFRGLSSLVAIVFEGDAPSVSGGWLYGANHALVVYYHSDATGFTSPTWQGVPTSMLGSTPTAPNELKMTVGNEQATLSWTAPSYTGGSNIDYYVVYQDGVDVLHVTETSAAITGLVNGQSYEFKVAAHNSDGMGQASNSLIATPSELIISSPDTAYLKSGTFSVEWAFDGNIQDLVRFVIVVDDGEEVEVPADEHGHLLSDLSEGTHIIKITAIGSAGVIVSSEVSLVVDTTDPTVTITSPSNGALVGSSVTVSWTAEDLSGVKVVEISTDGTTWTEVSGNSFELPGLSDGSRTVYVRVTDNAGNQAVEEVSFVVDTVKPTVIITSPSQNALVDSSVIITWASGGAIKTEVSTDGTTWAVVSGNSHELTGLSDGSHTVYVRVTDQAGNSEQTSVSFTVDAAAPTVTNKSPTGTGVAVSSAISITFSERMDSSSVGITINGVIGTMSWNGNVVVFTPYELQGNTEYTVTVTGKDLAGNELAATSWKFTTTNLGTVSGVIKDNDGNPVTGAKVTLRGGSAEREATTDQDGKYVFNDVAVGDYVLTVEKGGFSSYAGTVEVTSDSMTKGNVVNGVMGVGSGSGDGTLIIVGVAALVIAALVGAVLVLRRRLPIGPPKKD